MPLTIQALPRPTEQVCADEITIGLVNNMPDSALEATERQFSELLRAASGTSRVRLLFSTLPEVARGPAAAARLAADYWPLSRLQELPLDALIVTGMEPGAGPLDEAPYWPRFAQLVDWAQTHTISTIWSCLAAHAAVLRLDGIQRQRLPIKCFGVYPHDLLRGHPLLAGVAAPLLTPHSRWNELPAAALRSAGYTILSGSAKTGADAFVKEARSLFVFFQGHPEYEDTTLLKEYRRDVGRFVHGEQAHYPEQPDGYFSAAAIQLLDELRARILSGPGLDGYPPPFPAESVALGLHQTWNLGAVKIYGNWLALIAAEKGKLSGSSEARAQ